MYNLSSLEISKSALLHNYQQFRQFIHPKTKIISVVKANAYGHGLAQVVQVLENHTDYFAVDDIEELIILRNYTKLPTLVLGYIAKANLKEALLLNADIVIYDLERARILDQLAEEYRKKARVHIKIDASLGRQGLLLDQIKEFTQELKKLKHLQVIAAYAHFANIEDIGDPTEGAQEFSHARKQIDEFKQAVKIIMKNGFPDIKTHLSSTAGTFVYEKDHHNDDFIRLGIGLYGLWPSKNIQRVLESQGITLKPALRWISHIAQVKTLPANSTIGYGLTYKTYKETKIAIIPQGYSDGYDRELSNKGEVLIQGTRCKVLGRVMMNMIVVDVTHLAEVKPEEEVVLLGTQGSEIIIAEDLAEKTNTINYEIVSRINYGTIKILI